MRVLLLVFVIIIVIIVIIVMLELTTRDYDRPRRDIDNFVDISNDGRFLHEVIIPTSHNSILGAFHVFCRVNVSNLLRAINKGYRAVELDIFNGAVVSHGYKTLRLCGWVNLEDCLKAIKAQAWANTNAPFFVFLDLNMDDNTSLRRAAFLFKQYFGDRILRFNPDKPLAEYRVGELKNKLIIITRPGSVFDEIAHYIDFNKPAGSKLPVLKESPASPQLKRIYSDNWILSSNYNTIPYLNAGVNFVAVNANYKDDYLTQYEKALL